MNGARESIMIRRGITVIVIAVALGACSSSSKTSGTGGTKSVNASGSKTAASEVHITTCTKDALGDVEIKGTAVNDTSKRSDFSVELAITDKTGKTQLGTSIAIAQNVEPGQTALWDGPSDVTYQAGAVCKVSTVNRTASL